MEGDPADSAQDPGRRLTERIRQIGGPDVAAYRDQIAEALGWSAHRQSKEEPTSLAESYVADTDKALHAFIRGDLIVGVVGLLDVDTRRITIRHNGVRPEHRSQGIGRQMIEHLRGRYPGRTLIAETDRDALGFYQRCGFKIQSLGEKYPGIERFLCILPP